MSLGTLGSIYFDVYQGADFWIDQFDVWIKCLHSICKRILRTVDLILKINENYQFHTNDGLLELSGLKKIILDTKLSMKMKKKMLDWIFKKKNGLNSYHSKMHMLWDKLALTFKIGTCAL